MEKMAKSMTAAAKKVRLVTKKRLRIYLFTFVLLGRGGGVAIAMGVEELIY